MKSDIDVSSFPKMIKVLRFVLSLFVLLLVPRCAWSQKYKNPSGKQFPIAAWYALDREHNRPQDYKMLAEAGFNLSLSFFSSDKDVLRGLEACKGTGVKLISYCWEQRNKAEEFIPKIRSNKNLALYYVSDEPTLDDFNEVHSRVNTIRHYDEKHMCYVNLQPNYATPNQLKSANYKEYIEAYLNVFKPAMLSYDYYPFRYDGFREGYFENLSYIADVCKENAIPFWGFIMSATDNQYPQTNEAYLRFQAAMNLAYGAKGLQYFTYSKPSDNYMSAIVDNDYKKTEIYDIVKELNLEILQYSNVWLNSKVKKVWFVGSEQPQGLDSNYSCPQIDELLANGKGFIFSLFKSKGRQYLIAVNLDVDKKQELIIGGKRQLMLCNTDGVVIFIRKKFDVNPGDYLLIRL